MPKLKTCKTFAKRVVGISKNKSGLSKIRVRRMSAQHLATNKSHRSTHNAAKTMILKSGDAKKLRRLIPYAK